ncbi:MAG: cell wall hydrolase [Pseudobutyrivibrio sp.]|nr:cell wall hydrolase [Pseudobutyrivibrio sp.]
MIKINFSIKQMLQSAILVIAFAFLLIASIVNKTSMKETLVDGIAPARTAGIIAVAGTAELTSEQLVALSTENAEVELVAESVQAIEEPVDPILDEWEDLLMAQVDEYLSIRAEDDDNAEVVGKLKKGDVATVLGVADGWYEIESGNAVGYVNADYCVTGIEAYEYALDVCDVIATSDVAGLRIRAEASTDAKIRTVVPKGARLTVCPDLPEVEGWVAVAYDDTTGYVVSEYVDVDMETGEALTVQEEEEIRLAAEEAARKAKEAAEAAAAANQALIDSADDLTLIAAIIQAEAGWEPYEGQVGVANVVLNRVASPSYPNTVGEVIFAKGQFASSKMGKILSKGVMDSCIQAANDAMLGVNTVGGACHFRRAGNKEGLIIGHHVFY